MYVSNGDIVQKLSEKIHSPLEFPELSESNVRLKLTVVDTVGFGDQIDKTDRLTKTIFYSSSCCAYN